MMRNGLLLLWFLFLAGLYLKSYQPPTRIRFSEVTQEVGIDYAGTSFGAAWGDANGDGYPDLWASGHSPQRLLLNEQGRRFSDRTAEWISLLRYSDRHNAAWADFDNDGDGDLLQLSGADRGKGEDPNALYVNEDHRLTDQAKSLGIDYGLARTRAALWLDANEDGRLDVLITAAPRPEAPPALFLQKEKGFRSKPVEGLQRSEIAQLALLSSEPEPYVLTGPPHQLFAYQISPAGLRETGATFGFDRPLAPWTADLLAADLDNDGLQDLVFLRGGLRPAVRRVNARHLEARLQSYWGQPQSLRFAGSDEIQVSPYPLAKQWWGKGRIFIGAQGKGPESIPLMLNKDDPAVQGLAMGKKGLFLGYDAGAQRWIIEMRDPKWNSVNLQVQGDKPLIQLVQAGFPAKLEPLEQPIRWNEGGHFPETAQTILTEDNCFSGAAGDFDNDGDLDLYLVCGGYLGNRPNRLFENLGNRQFQAVPDAGGASGTALGIGDSVAVADYDLDGALDLFVRNGRGLVPFARGPDQLFRNLGTGNHWIELDLEGTRSNRDGIGARIIAITGKRRQMRLADNGTHGRVQDSHRIHFGLGSYERVTIQVDWPSGIQRIYGDLAADRVWILREDGSRTHRFSP